MEEFQETNSKTNWPDALNNTLEWHPGAEVLGVRPLNTLAYDI